MGTRGNVDELRVIMQLENRELCIIHLYWRVTKQIEGTAP